MKNATVTTIIVVLVLTGCIPRKPPENSGAEWVQPTQADHMARVAEVAGAHEKLDTIQEFMEERAGRLGDSMGCMYTRPQGLFICVNSKTSYSYRIESPEVAHLKLTGLGVHHSPGGPVPIYQPKDKGRVFISVRGANQAQYWIMYDPKGRDVQNYLKDNGFTNVHVVNSKIAVADQIDDPGKRSKFWIWLQRRENRIKEFEAKYPHLAETVDPKTVT